MDGHLWDFFQNLDAIFGVMERQEADKVNRKNNG
jgi:hypothetical protein